MALQPLDEVRKALSNAWDLTRAGFWWRAAESAARDREWATAAERLLHLADALDDVESYAPAWRQLAVATLDAAVRAKDADLVTAACAQLLARAWDPRDGLDALTPVFRTSEVVDAVDAGGTLAQIVRQRYAGSPWAQYAAAHFAELRGRPSNPATAIESFRRAAVLFEERGDERAAHHCGLRAAVAQMAYTTQHDEGRKALRELASETPDGERYWLAFGQLHSPFWLDRVRAADWVVDALSTDGTDANARAVAGRLVAELPIRLADAEHDRLRGVAEDLHDDLRWVIEAQLRGREAAAELLDLPLAELDAERARALAHDALPLRDLDTLARAWRGEEVPVPASEPVAAAVVDVLLAAPDSRVDAMVALAGVVRSADNARALRPLLLVFARTTHEPELAGPLTELALHYSHRAPTPSCGFLQLARMFFSAGLHRAGAALTQRALDEAEQHPTRETCVARAVAWAVREASDREMLAWLEIGERELG